VEAILALNHLHTSAKERAFGSTCDLKDGLIRLSERHIDFALVHSLIIRVQGARQNQEILRELDISSTTAQIHRGADASPSTRLKCYSEHLVGVLVIAFRTTLIGHVCSVNDCVDDRLLPRFVIIDIERSHIPCIEGE
jgi:hypothetical protein